MTGISNWKDRQVQRKRKLKAWRGVRKGDSAENSGGKVCAGMGNGQISQMTKGELREKYPTSQIVARGAFWEGESCKANSTQVAISVIPYKIEMTAVMGSETPTLGTDSAVV